MTAKILYVDDDRANLVVFKATFDATYQVLTAESATQGLELLRAHRDVVLLITDQRMPHTAGVELCETVRQEFPDVVRFLITAYSDLSAAIDAINLGQVHRYLRKPWQPDELRRQLEEGIELGTLRVRTRELERRMREVERIYALGVVAAGLVHELRNPLTAVLGALDLVRMKGDVREPDLVRMLDEASAAARVMAEILRGVELSSRRSVPTGTADLSTIVSMTFRMLKADMIRRATPEFQVEPNLIVRAAPTPVGQVVLNLLLNAIQSFDPMTSPSEARILVVGRAVGGCARLEISDTGPGIPVAMRTKIFDAFFTTKVDGGTGLGLAISRQIVTDAGGTLIVTDTPGGGATFVVELPLA